MYVKILGVLALELLGFEPAPSHPRLPLLLFMYGLVVVSVERPEDVEEEHSRFAIGLITALLSRKADTGQSCMVVLIDSEYRKLQNKRKAPNLQKHKDQ